MLVVAGKHVDVAVKHEMSAGAGASKGGHEVRRMGQRRDPLGGMAALGEPLVEDSDRLAGIARRVRAPRPHETGKQVDHLLAVRLNPAEQARAVRLDVHATPSSASPTRMQAATCSGPTPIDGGS